MLRKVFLLSIAYCLSTYLHGLCQLCTTAPFHAVYRLCGSAIRRISSRVSAEDQNRFLLLRHPRNQHHVIVVAIQCGTNFSCFPLQEFCRYLALICSQGSQANCPFFGQIFRHGNGAEEIVEHYTSPFIDVWFSQLHYYSMTLIVLRFSISFSCKTISIQNFKGLCTN